MSAPKATGQYSAPSGEHVVLVVRDPAGRWQVLDRDAVHVTLVETLTGHDDRLDQAIALARDYADQQQAYHDGRRESDPLPGRATIHGALDAA
jgi:hypothetical protein